MGNALYGMACISASRRTADEGQLTCFANAKASHAFAPIVAAIEAGRLFLAFRECKAMALAQDGRHCLGYVL